MSGGPRFPRQPLAGLETAFRGADGKNPFADATLAPTESSGGAETQTGQSPPATTSSSNLFASSVPAGFVQDPSLYEAILPHRGPLVARLGWAGFLGAFFGVVVVGPVFYYFWALLANLSLIVVTGALVVCVAAIYLGRSDLQAMRLGAMQPDGRAATRRGYVLAWLGVLLGLGAWAGLGYSILSYLDSP